MNHHELLTLTQSCHAILTFLVNRGLLAARRRCFVEIKWVYEMLTVMMVITGNVQSTCAENESPSELVLFLRITKSHCHTACISSSCGRLTSPTRDFETPAP